jgi:hypothetical protein
VFTARYALNPYIKQIRFVFKSLNQEVHYGIEKIQNGMKYIIIYAIIIIIIIIIIITSCEVPGAVPVLYPSR